MAMAVLLLAAMNPSVAARDADLRLRPNEGVSGESVEAKGKAFPAGASGEVYWEDVTEPVASFTVDDDGTFSTTLTVPDVVAGTYVVRAVSGDTEATDDFEVEAPETAEAGDPAVPEGGTPMPPWMGEYELAREGLDFVETRCGQPGARDVPVANAADLTAALAATEPGDRILLADGVYRGNFEAVGDGTAEQPIMLCGTRNAVLDGGGWEHSGYGLHLTGDFWRVEGITVTNAQKGVVADGVTGVVLDGIEVFVMGHEAVHFRAHSTGNTVQRSDIHDTGLDNEKFGEGVYLGTAVSNWERYTDGEPDRSDGNRVLANRIWATSSESVDLKEGSVDGTVAGNLFDGSGLRGADSWVDAKGSGYRIEGNVGMNSPQDGFQTHVIDNMEWGRNNVFTDNLAMVNGPGVGFYIHQGPETGNVVMCSNVVEGAEGGFTNLEDGCME